MDTASRWIDRLRAKDWREEFATYDEARTVTKRRRAQALERLD